MRQPLSTRLRAHTFSPLSPPPGRVVPSRAYFHWQTLKGPNLNLIGSYKRATSRLNLSILCLSGNGNQPHHFHISPTAFEFLSFVHFAFFEEHFLQGKMTSTIRSAVGISSSAPPTRSKAPMTGSKVAPKTKATPSTTAMKKTTRPLNSWLAFRSKHTAKEIFPTAADLSRLL